MASSVSGVDPAVPKATQLVLGRVIAHHTSRAVEPQACGTPGEWGQNPVMLYA